MLPVPLTGLICGQPIHGLAISCGRPLIRNYKCHSLAARGRPRPARGGAVVAEEAEATVKQRAATRSTDVLERAQQLISTGDPSDVPRQINKLLSSLSVRQRVLEAVALYKLATSSRIALDALSYQSLTWALLQSGALLDAASLLRQYSSSKDAGPPPVQLYTAVINALLAAKQRGRPVVKAAYALWQQLQAEQGSQLDAAAYRAGLHACVCAGQLQQGESLLEAMRGARLAPDMRCYNILLKYHVQRGDVGGAQALLRRMRLYQVAPDLVTYNTLLKGHVEAGDMGRAHSLMEAIKAQGLRPDAVSYTCSMRGAGCRPSVVTYGTLIDGAMRANDLGRARRLMAAMRSEDGLLPNRVIYNTLLRGCCKMGGEMMGQAALLVAEMKAAGVPLGNDTRDILANAGLLSHDDGWPAAQQAVVPDSGSTSTSASSSNGNGNGYHNGNGSSSHDDIAADRAGMDNIDTISSAEAGAGHGGSSNGSLLPPLRSQAGALDPPPSLDEAGGAGSGNGSTSSRSSSSNGSSSGSPAAGGGFSPDTANYTSRAMALLANGQYEAALRCFDQAAADPRAGLDLVALSALVHVHASTGRMEEAEKAADTVVQAAQALSVRPPVGAFGALISGYQSQGELRRLLATYRRFLGLGGLPHTRMLNMVVRSCLAAGETKVALQAVRAAQLVGLQVDVDKYRAWAQQYAAAAGAGAKHPAAASRAAAPSAADDYDEDADEPQAPSAPVSSATSGHQEPAANKEMERFKWWMGLPNKYYS